MLGSLLAGIVAAIGHHVFYMHYNNRPVRSTTEQRYLSNAGTGFAFLVKTLLAMATVCIEHTLPEHFDILLPWWRHFSDDRADLMRACRALPTCNFSGCR